jgi:nicotinamide-nucleotide amidase
MPEAQDQIEIIVGQLLRDRHMTLAVAESCTGGLIAYRITNVPGSSDYFRGSITAYANEVKQGLLGVLDSALAEHGAVSERVARQMAAGVRRALHADVGISATGIAGPTGGTAEKPVGLVYIGLDAGDGAWVEHHVFEEDRWGNKMLAAEAALDLLGRYLRGLL